MVNFASASSSDERPVDLPPGFDKAVEAYTSEWETTIAKTRAQFPALLGEIIGTFEQAATDLDSVADGNKSIDVGPEISSWKPDHIRALASRLRERIQEMSQS